MNARVFANAWPTTKIDRALFATLGDEAKRMVRDDVSRLMDGTRDLRTAWREALKGF